MKRLLVTLGLVVAAIFPIFPLYWMAMSSLKSPEELSRIPPRWWPSAPTFEAYRTVFEVIPFGRAFGNSLVIAGLGTISVLVTSVAAGYAFAKYRFAGRDALFWSMVATMFLPPIVTLVPLYWMVSELGLADTYLGVLLPWLANPFGVFLRTPDVEAIAARVDDLIIRPGGILRHREWGLYEVGVCGPDGLLVRIGWPSRLMQDGSTIGGA